MEHTPASPGNAAAARFGALITRLAHEAGYDVSPGSGGRSALARDAGMSPSSVGRMLDGKTLPAPNQLEGLARTVQTDVRELLVTAGVITDASWPKHANPDVLSASAPSQPPSPEAVADMWGLTEQIREMFLGSARQAIRLQAQANAGRSAERGEALGRG
ncbi:helix-turn-helix domain-containing protein [Streptomyces californicus]|uniref:helix-turn-helix domain-containing protein n=1 Tax=Streptomyces californicus TaxID=67351 RepID=UPI00382928DA